MVPSENDQVVIELRGRTLSSLSRPQLQRYCTRLKLPGRGTNVDLLARLESAILAATSSTQTTTPPSSIYAPPIASTAAGVPTLPLVLSNLGPPGQSTWLQSIAHQAAQAAVYQAIVAQSQVHGLGTINTPPLTSAQGQPPPLTTPTQTSLAPASANVMSAPTISVQGYPPPLTTTTRTSLAPAYVYSAPIISPTTNIQSAQPTQPPSTAPQQVTLVSPMHSAQSLALPTAASTALTGYNLPGELSGMIPHNTIQKILTLQYFDLASLLPSNCVLLHDPQPIQVQLGGSDNQQLVLSRRPTQKKQIASIQDWVLAFSAYAAVLTTAHPSRAADLFEYTRLIVQAHQEYRGHAWLRYDTAFRKKAANRGLHHWADIDSILWNRAFSGQSNATALCSICFDTTHATGECALFTPGPAQRSSPGPTSNSSKTVCLNWNKGICNYNPCRRAHICATPGCGGDHRFTSCPKRRSSPRKQ